MAKKITLVEVGARDGLQNEKKVLNQDIRLEFARRLVDAGLKKIELGAFVSPKWVPQMVGSSELFSRAQKESVFKKVELSALVPNVHGMNDAVAAGVKHVAIFGSASEAFSQKNINCSIDESLQRFEQIMVIAKKNKIKVRGYLSMCFGCPFEGDVPEERVVKLVKKFAKLGIYEISIGDTVGVADPAQVKRLVSKLKTAVGAKKLAMHFHDTRGTALANVLAALDLGITVFDSSLGGLGGCPYSPNSTGNVATEDVVYMLERMGYTTGVDLPKLIELNKWMTESIGHPLPSRVSKAGIPKR